MADEWIKMRRDLPADPAVILICERLQMDEDLVVGKLHRLWSWADSHTTNGALPHVTLASLDRIVRAQNFAQSLRDAGWLEVDENGCVRIPHFTRHNGKSSKQRALAARRASRKRHADRNAKRVTKRAPREEKRREEKSKESTNVDSFIPLPPSIDSPGFRDALNRWLSYKAERREPYKPQGVSSMVSRASNLAGQHGLQAVIDAMERAMANGWQGWDQESSFAQKGLFNGNRNGKQPSAGQQYRPGGWLGAV